MEIVTIVISVASLFVASSALGWNIYRDVIQRPRFRVSVSIRSIYQAEREPEGPYIFVEALNLGPLPNRLGMVFARKSWWQRWIKRDRRYAFIYPDFAHMATTPAGTRIEVGDQGTFVFPYDKDCFLQTEFVNVGVADGYGRTHWAKRAQVRMAREQFQKDFSAG